MEPPVPQQPEPVRRFLRVARDKPFDPCDEAMFLARLGPITDPVALIAGEELLTNPDEKLSEGKPCFQDFSLYEALLFEAKHPLSSEQASKMCKPEGMEAMQ